MKFDNLGLSNVTRREALAAMGLMALACKTGFGTAAAAETTASAEPFVTPKPGGSIALQLYTMREPAKKDLAGTLKKCRDIGWEYVQWSGMPAKMSADEICDALKAADLKCISAHVGMEPFEKDFDAQSRFWKKVGAKDLAPGGMMKDCQKTLADWLRGAKRLDAIGAKLREVGMRLSYHNHTFEFEKFDGDPRTKLDILLESTSPENLYDELDVAWALAAGADPAAFIRKYKGRMKCLHCKDVIPGVTSEPHGGKLVALGQGKVNWQDVLAAARETGVEWYIYEQDRGEGTPFEFAKTSYEFLSKLVGG